VSVYREPVGRNAVLFQIGELSSGDGDLTGDSAAGETVPRAAAGSASGTGPLLGIGPALAPRAPYQPPANLAKLVSECEVSGLLTVSKVPRGQSRAAGDIPPVFIEPRTAAALHRELLATGRGDEVIRAPPRAARYQTAGRPPADAGRQTGGRHQNRSGWPGRGQPSRPSRRYTE
jgi:hypothetical protein